MLLFYVLYVHCRGRAVTNVGKSCGPTPCLTRAINMFKPVNCSDSVEIRYRDFLMHHSPTKLKRV